MTRLLWMSHTQPVEPAQVAAWLVDYRTLEPPARRSVCVWVAAVWKRILG